RGLSEAVLLLGQRTDIPRLLRTADLFLFPSRTEGLPNALLEAMAAGLPIVATDVPGCRDLISHAQTGLLAPAGNAAAIASATATLLHDRAQAERLGRAALARVRERMDISRLASRWAE